MKKIKITFSLFFTLLFLLSFDANNVYTQDRVPETILPEELIDNIINEVSGTLPYNHVIELGAYNRDRLKSEYEGIYWESEYMVEKARKYGYTDAHIEHLAPGGKQWDVEIGELWMVEPDKKLIISHRDEPTCIAYGSATAEVTAELILVGAGTREEDYKGIDVEGKIVLATGSGSGWNRGIGSVYELAVQKYNAKGVLCFNTLRPIDRPDQISWAGFRGRKPKEGTIAFNLTHRIGYNLMERLLSGEKIKLSAKVKTHIYDTDQEVTTAVIPGKTDEELVFVAHLFEGITKQGAIDNFSGSAVIMEAGRTINNLIKNRVIPQPERTIRFLWVPEIYGTMLYLQKYPEEAKKIISAINLDMVGEDQKKGENCMVLHLTPHSYFGFLNDICQEFYEYVGRTNIETIFDRKFLKPILDIHGSRDPFKYRIDPHFGSSDHIIFLSPLYKVPSVMFINWPDPVYHTNQDRAYMADPTQLKRVAFITAASGITIAYSTSEDVLKLGTMMLAKSKDRIADDVEKFTKLIYNSNKDNVHINYKEAKIGIEQAYKRESRSIGSLLLFAKENKEAVKTVHNLQKMVMTTLNEDLNLIDNYYKLICDNFGKSPEKIVLSDTEKKADVMIPVLKQEDISLRSLFIRGGKIKGFPANELLNFIDGERSILEIRNMVSAEYYPLKIEDVIEHYKRLEERGTIEIREE